MNRSIKTIGAITCGLALWLVLPARAAVVYQDTLESDTQGNPPGGGWSFGGTSPNAYGVVAAPPNAVPSNGANALNYYDNDTNAKPSGIVSFSSAISTDFKVNFSFDYNYQASTNSGANTLVRLADATNGGLLLNLQPNGGPGNTTGEVLIWNRSASPGFSSPLYFTTGQWYHLSAALTPVGNGSGHQATLTVTSLSGGADPGSVTFSYEPITTGFNRILVGENAVNSLNDNSSFLDNFLVTAVPEPSTVMLFGLGAAVLLSRRNRQRLRP